MLPSPCDMFTKSNSSAIEILILDFEKIMCWRAKPGRGRGSAYHYLRS